MKKVFIITQAEIDSMKRYVNEVYQAIAHSRNGQMSEAQALRVVENYMILLSSDLEDVE